MRLIDGGLGMGMSRWAIMGDAFLIMRGIQR